MVTTTWSQTAGMTSDTETDNIADYAEQAEASKDAAAASETAAQSSASASASSASGSSSSAAAALASENAAATSETNAATSASTATTQASNSSTSATASETSRVASVAAQAAAETAETAAETAQTAAEAAEAGVAADAATATAQAAIATTQATNSGTSATASEVSRVAAVAAQAAAETAETNAETAETNAETAQTAAETAETNAASSSSSASTSASTATTQAGIATTKAGEAATSATESATSATASEAAKDAALAALDNFQDQYLGDFATDPTTDNDGDPLQAGMLYYNTTDDVMKVYTGSAWVAAYASLSGALLTTNNLSDLVNVPSARTNLGLGTAATTAASAYATSAQGGLADSSVQPNDSPSFGSVTVSGTVDGRDVSSDGTKLDGIETGANVTDTANVTAAGAAMETGAAFTGNVTFGDNDKAIFGAGSDLQIYHDGSNSLIKDVGAGDLNISAGNDLRLQDSSGNNYFKAGEGGSSKVYYNGAEKLATTATGISVTGSVTVSGTVDGRDVASDGSKLDGIEAGATADQTAAQILTAIKTVDGVGSGLDADLLDGFATSTGENNSTVAVRNASGYLFANYFNGSGTFSTTGANSGMGRFTGTNGIDTYGHSYTAAAARALLNVADGATSYTANQSLNTSNSPSFAGVNINGNLNAVDNIYLAATVFHEGDTNTYLSFSTDTVYLASGGTDRVIVNNNGVRLGDTGNGYFRPVSGNYGSIEIDGGAHGGYEGYSIGGRVVLMHDNSSTSGIYNDVNNEWMIQMVLNGAVNLYYNGVSKLDTVPAGVSINGSLFTDGSNKEDYDALSGTSPTCNTASAGAFSLTMTGNTTFTFSSTDAGAGWSQGFILQLTGNGSTVTWPSSVDWAGGTAPDAPASGESNLYVFWSRDGGSNWNGVLSSAAYA